MSVFDFLSKNKEYYSCEWLEYGVHFAINGVFHCCMFGHSYKNDIPVSPLLGDYSYDFNDYLKKKKNDIKSHKKGIIIDRCKGCAFLQKKTWNKKFQLNKLAMNINTKCNANCIYCYTGDNKSYYNSRPDISFLKILERMIKKNILSKDCRIQISGGEPTLHKEFDSIINLLISNSFNNIIVLTSGIKYSKIIEKTLSEDKCEVFISPDCGNKELFKKIKRVDAFDKVWDNIRSYYKAQGKDKNKVKVKYIIIDRVNDDKHSIDEFFEKIIQIGIKAVIVDLEINAYKSQKNNQEYLNKMLFLINYITEYAAKSNIEYHYGVIAYNAVQAK